MSCLLRATGRLMRKEKRRARKARKLSVVAEKPPGNSGRSPGSEVQPRRLWADSPSPADSRVVDRIRALTYSGGTAQDLHRLPCYALNGHPSAMTVARTRRRC